MKSILFAFQQIAVLGTLLQLKPEIPTISKEHSSRKFVRSLLLNEYDKRHWVCLAHPTSEQQHF